MNTIDTINLAWTTTRAAGIVALLASTGSIVLGLALAGRLSKGPGKLGDVRMLHQTLGVATIAALLVHVLSLLLDPWLQPTVSQLAVPFALDYRPLWTGLGIIAGYGFLVLGMSGFIRKYLGSQWKLVHRFTGLAWVAAVAHSLGAGSDAGSAWFWAVIAVCVVPVVVLLAMRVAAANKKPAARPRTPRPVS
jgi:sulfoxide reductase heme-binding subunit YedZ